MLGCFGPLDADRASLADVPEFDDVSWIRGERIVAPLPKPIDLDLDTSEGSVMVPMFDEGILVMSDAMIEALQQAGADNLQLFDVVLHDRQGGKDYPEYKAVNIVGAIACADLDASEFEAFGEPVIDVDFDSLSIDASRTGGALLFRLAECVTGIVVHDAVKRQLERNGIQYLYFLPPREWVG